MPITPITIHSIHTGQPRTINDEGGRWQSSIFRELIEGPILLTEGGLVGDKVTDTRHHGSADQAVCCHSMDHYRHWQEVYGADLGAGAWGKIGPCSTPTRKPSASGTFLMWGAHGCR